MRRVIRVIMIALAITLLAMGLCVPIANNAIAIQDAKALQSLALPAETTVLESTSAAGRFTHTAGHVQYFSAMLIQSELSLEELRAHYAQYTKDLLASYRVEQQTEQEISVLDNASLSFRQAVEGDGYYIVYVLRTGGNSAQWWLDMDVRG